MNDEQIHAMSVLLVAASGRKTPLTMQAAEEMLREIIGLPRGPFVQPEPVYWQWRRSDEEWSLKMTFNSEPVVTMPGTEMRPIYAGPVVAYGVQGTLAGQRQEGGE